MSISDQVHNQISQSPPHLREQVATALLIQALEKIAAMHEQIGALQATYKPRRENHESSD